MIRIKYYRSSRRLYSEKKKGYIHHNDLRYYIKNSIEFIVVNPKNNDDITQEVIRIMNKKPYRKPREIIDCPLHEQANRLLNESILNVRACRSNL